MKVDLKTIKSPLFKNIAGMKFGKLSVIMPVDHAGRAIHWQCKCECGAIRIVQGGKLRTGLTTSCGSCSHVIHGHAKRNNVSRVYRIWKLMRTRCTDESIGHFKYYGGRGIAVCKRWQNFNNFVADMGEPPSNIHSIDRINVNGNYTPSNCKWSTPKEQAMNRRVTHNQWTPKEDLL